MDDKKLPKRIEIKAGKSAEIDVKTTRGEGRRSESGTSRESGMGEQDRTMGTSREQ